MIISVASGKGGTGKTTIAVNLAFSLESNVLLLDCDVEEPNSHLFLNPKIERREIVYTSVPQIDHTKCTLCKKCSEICRFKAIVALKETVLVFPELCHSCGGCIEVCPEKAVSEIGREIGEIEIGSAGYIGFISGSIKIGEAMSPPLIRKVKSYVDIEKINIIDAPPGTSCPVIAAMKGSDFVLLVTEPTPFGLYDLKLAVEAVKLLNIPCGLVINRSDIGNNDVKDYAKREDIPILLEIPFQRKIAEVYSRGKLVVCELPEWKDRFLNLYKQINEVIIRCVN